MASLASPSIAATSMAWRSHAPSCPPEQDLTPLLASPLVQRHLCRAGAEFGTCASLYAQHNCTHTPSSGAFTAHNPLLRPLRCGVDTCCPSWRDGACWMCGLRWHSLHEVSPPGCAAGVTMARLGRAEIGRCLRGKLLVFQGDSLTRQIFNRLIWWLRGIDSNLEHYYQKDAYYSFSATDDRLTIRTHSRREHAARDAATWRHVDAALAGNATLDPARAHVVLMMFRNSAWRETDENIQGGRFLRGKFCDETRTTDCIVREREGGAAGYRHGGGIGWGRAPLAGVVQGQMGRVAVHRPRPDGGGVDLALLSVGAIAASAPVELERNVVCMEADGSGGLNWTRAAGAMIDHGHASKLPPVCAHQDGHFQCSFGPLGREPTRSFKRPLSGDCRDVANLNALQLILTSLCAT